MNAAQTLRRWRLVLCTLAAVVVAAVVMWEAGAWNPTAVDGGTGTAPPGNGRGQGGEIKPGLDLYPRGQRTPVPALEGSTLDGTRFALGGVVGNIVVINVWGSWCAPCRAETPDLVRVANEHRDRDVRFVGIDARDNTAAAQAFVRAFKVPYPSVEDPQGQVLLAFRGVVPVSVVPSTVVVDRQGLVAARIIGPVTYTTLTGILDDELAADQGGDR